jgi:thiosulfate dehydrogenase [quinone] large subunit
METTTVQEQHRFAPWIMGLLRVAMGWMFFWAFLDKLFGLGFATKADKAWLDGVSPTLGFLKFGAKGPFVEMFHAMAGNPIVDWLFMLGLLGVGLAMILGIGVRVAGFSGAAIVLLMWLVVMPPANNPFMDDHIIYALVFVWFACRPDAGAVLGLGKWWSRMPFVQRMPFLR